LFGDFVDFLVLDADAFGNVLAFFNDSVDGSFLGLEFKGLFPDSTIKFRWSSISKFRVNAFTAIQMSCVAAMMWINQSRFGVLSPLVIALLPVLRKGILTTGIVDQNEMDILDQEMDSAQSACA
jgi:hypothetical protein